MGKERYLVNPHGSNGRHTSNLVLLVTKGVQAIVEAKLKRMIELGILKPIDFSKWAAPIVARKKKNGKPRVCADFKTALKCIET